MATIAAPAIDPLPPALSGCDEPEPPWRPPGPPGARLGLVAARQIVAYIQVIMQGRPHSALPVGLRVFTLSERRRGHGGTMGSGERNRRDPRPQRRQRVPLPPMPFELATWSRPVVAPDDDLAQLGAVVSRQAACGGRR